MLVGRTKTRVVPALPDRGNRVKHNNKNTKLEGHSVKRITSDKGRYPTAQLIWVFVVLDVDL